MKIFIIPDIDMKMNYAHAFSSMDKCIEFALRETAKRNTWDWKLEKFSNFDEIKRSMIDELKRQLSKFYEFDIDSGETPIAHKGATKFKKANINNIITPEILRVYYKYFIMNVFNKDEDR